MGKGVTSCRDHVQDQLKRPAQGSSQRAVQTLGGCQCFHLGTQNPTTQLLEPLPGLVQGLVLS